MRKGDKTVVCMWVTRGMLLTHNWTGWASPWVFQWYAVIPRAKRLATHPHPTHPERARVYTRATRLKQFCGELAAPELVKITTFGAAGDGGFGLSNDVSVSVMCDVFEAASFDFQLFHFIHISTHNAAFCKQCRCWKIYVGKNHCHVSIPWWFPC